MKTLHNAASRTLTGAGLGMSVLVIYSLLIMSLRGSPLRGAIATPYFAFSYPAFSLAEYLFGQAPIPIFVVVGVYWLLAGALIGLIWHGALRAYERLKRSE